MKSRWTDAPAALAVALLVTSQVTAAYQLDLNSTDSLKSIASDLTEDMMSFYDGDKPGGVPGLLPRPYYWWEAGALMGALVDYWYYTGDTRWNDVAEKGLLFQTGPNNDYMPPNQTMTEGNDDQGFWGMAAMSAAEYNFQNPPSDKPQWLALAQAVFNTQADRWDTQECGGGLRWQIFTWNNGFDYKNSISQACFFNIASRLARYTGNQTYADWADKTWNWMEDSKLLGPNYYVYDGTHIGNCSEITPYQWTYNAGAFLLGAAAMYNYTTGSAQETWRERVDGLLDGIKVFFTGNKSNIMTEVACEPVNLCDLDQQSFKAYLSRWMAATTKWAPWTYDRIKPLLEASATAAVSTCIGGDNGRMCGLKWTEHGKFDNSIGVGQQMAAMEIVLANMIQHATHPVTNNTGGTSAGDPGAGGSDVGRTNPFSMLNSYPPVTTAGQIGAYVCTVIFVLGLISGCAFVLAEEASDQDVEKSASHRLFGMGRAARGSGGILGRTHRRSDSDAKGKRALMKRSNSAGSSIGYSLEKDDIVIKTHYLVPTEEAYFSTPRPAPRPPAPQPQPRGHRRVPSDSSSYWNNNGEHHHEYHPALSPPRREQYVAPRDQQSRLSYPRVVKMNSSLRKKAIQNRVVHWRDTNSPYP